MARYILQQIELPEASLLDFLAKTGLSLAQASDVLGWPYDTLKGWSKRKGPTDSKDRQLLGAILTYRLDEIRSILSELE